MQEQNIDTKQLTNKLTLNKRVYVTPELKLLEVQSINSNTGAGGDGGTFSSVNLS